MSKRGGGTLLERRVIVRSEGIGQGSHIVNEAGMWLRWVGTVGNPRTQSLHLNTWLQKKGVQEC